MVGGGSGRLGSNGAGGVGGGLFADTFRFRGVINFGSLSFRRL
jgi:hypothetical protein